MQSVKVVRITPADNAGSIFMRRSISGTITPTSAAHRRLMSVAAAMMAAAVAGVFGRFGDGVQGRPLLAWLAVAAAVWVVHGESRGRAWVSPWRLRNHDSSSVSNRRTSSTGTGSR